MKAICTKSLFLLILFCYAVKGNSQTLPSGLAAKFGIDGDIWANERQNGTFTAAGSHDWFKRTTGTGIGLIDTTGAAEFRKQIMTGANISFFKRMQYQRYLVQDEVVIMDGCYARDFQSTDKTVFTGNGTKNTTSPADWGTAPNGSPVSDKTDIIDTYVSIRRNGSVVSGSGSGSLITTMALTTLATGGDRYADFEFYKERIRYNTTTGKFENSGPAAFGGHSLWEFNTDGSVRSWGDMTISFSFNSSSVSNIKILVWVAQTTAQTVNPKGFDFIPGEFYASTSASAYGYAAIKPDGAGEIVAWGTVNTATTSTPSWGSNSKDIGSNNNNYFTDLYSVGQFAEAAVDLTALGMDPATFMNMSACNPPFTRFMTKSRSSSAFTSSLSDFNGPFEFLDVPTVPATTTIPGPLSCAASTVNLSSANYLQGAFYSWTTAGGNIAGSNNDSSTITVDKPGTYYLSAAITKGCIINVDSVVVTEDNWKPKASASVSNMLYPGAEVTLYGGDVAASNYTTPFGGSQGLWWNWKGPIGFTSTEQNPTTGHPGEYKLVVTEKRNGCSDSVLVYVTPYPTLPVTFTAFTITRGAQAGYNLLSWKVEDAGSVLFFEIEKSSDGRTYVSFAKKNAMITALHYSIYDAVPEADAYYRIKATANNGKIIYSPVVKVSGNNQPSNLLTITAGGAKTLLVTYKVKENESFLLQLTNSSGQVIWKETVPLQQGSGQKRIQLSSSIPPGIYWAIVAGKEKRATAKIRL